MSVQRALPAPLEPRAPSRSIPLRAPRRKRRIFLILLTVFLSLILSLGILLLSPPVLEGMSAMIVPPQKGAIQWNGHDRITVVAMGLTQRTTEPARTDTLLAMDIDPPHHRITMLSVPRDLWVDIPGYGQGKLAIAYEVGGPKLAAYTLEKDLNIPVDYTMAMTFRGFINVVDAMGGVTVDVPQELNDPSYPCLTGYDYCPIDIKPGVQHMDGQTALEFVRERHAFAQQDLARVKDQQAFATAVKHTVLSPITWLRFPAILHAFQQGLITNMPWNDIPVMGAQFVFPLTKEDHQYINVENGLLKGDWSNDGQSILSPTDSTSIPNLVHRVFADDTLAKENASVAVLNGTETAGLASEVQGTLQGLSYRIVSAGNADRLTYIHSRVIVNTAVSGDGDYTARRLQRLLNADLTHESLPDQSAKVVIIVGRDFPTAQ